MKPEFDARKISPEAQNALRIRAVSCVVEDGRSPDEVAASFKVCRASVYNWLARFGRGGYEALKSRPHQGPRSRLDEEQEAWLSASITLQTPRDWGFERDLWTRALIAEVIEREFGVRYTPRGVGKLLHRLDFSCQKPVRRAYQQDPAAVEAWKKKPTRT